MTKKNTQTAQYDIKCECGKQIKIMLWTGYNEIYVPCACGEINIVVMSLTQTDIDQINQGDNTS